jgi:hypothetical protein
MGMGYTAEYVSSKSPEQIAREMTDISNRRIAADNRSLKLRTALTEAESVLALMERPADEDPEYATAVQAIGDGVSYGAIMSSTEALWRQYLQRTGSPEGGEHVHGPARATVIKALTQVRAALST